MNIKSDWWKHFVAIMILMVLLTPLLAAFAYLVVWTNQAVISINSHQLQILYDQQWTFWTGFGLTIATIIVAFICVFSLLFLFDDESFYVTIAITLCILVAIAIWATYLTLLIVNSILINYNNTNNMGAYNPLLIAVLVLSIFVNLSVFSGFGF